MEEKPKQSVFFHFRFKFLAITTIAFLFYVILSSSAEFDQFVHSMQFKLMGPFFIITGILFIVFRRFPIKCPYCQKINSTKKDWVCADCGKSQGKKRYLMDKCLHCRQIQAVSSCEHCSQEFKL